MTHKLITVQPYFFTGDEPGVSTWDGSTQAAIGTFPTGLDADYLAEHVSDNASVVHASSGGPRATLFSGRMYAIIANTVYETSDGSSWTASVTAPTTPKSTSLGTNANNQRVQGGGALFVLNTGITTDSTIVPRLWAFFPGSTSHQFSVCYAPDPGAGATTWVTYANDVSWGETKAVLGGALDTNYPLGTSAVRGMNKLWFTMSNEGSTGRGKIGVYDPETNTTEYFDAGATTNEESSVHRVTRWQDGMYWVARKTNTTVALYKYSSGNASEVTLTGDSFPTHTDNSDGWQGSDFITFVDPATNNLIAFVMTGNITSTAAYKIFSITTGNVATDISSSVEISETSTAEHRRASRLRLWIDPESGSGTDTRTPTIKLFYTPSDSNEIPYTSMRIPIKEITWNGISSPMTVNSTSAGASWQNEAGDCDGLRTYTTSKCNPEVVTYSFGANKVSYSIKLYVVPGGSTTADWKVSLYFRGAGQAYPTTRAALTNAEQSSSAMTITDNVIQGVTAHATAPAVLTFDWDLSAEAQPADGDKVGFVVYAHQ